MSYEKPKEIRLNEHDPFIAIATKNVERELEAELNKIGLTMRVCRYYENSYCTCRSVGCTCPHWFAASIELLYPRIYEVRPYFWVCKRKRVYEIRWGHQDEATWVFDDFWINTKTERTQVAGKYIHSYGLKQAAEDMKIAHQAAEIKHYKSKNYNEYYAAIFKKTP